MSWSGDKRAIIRSGRHRLKLYQKKDLNDERALLLALILKSFNLKYLVGEGYKGWISWPPLSVHSSMKYILCLCFELSIPCGEYLFHDATRLNYLVYSGLIKHLVLALSFAFHAEGVLYHGTPK